MMEKISDVFDNLKNSDFELARAIDKFNKLRDPGYYKLATEL
jgi:DNA polymerase IIIc chi subunit